MPKIRETVQRVNKVLSLVVASIGLICFAPAAFSATVSMELIGPPPGPSMGGVYTSPYTALIGAPGQTQPVIAGVATPVICDDFTTDVSTSTPPWQAVVTGLSSLYGESNASQTVKFDHTSSAAQQEQDYTVAAYLAFELMSVNQSTKAGQIEAGELSFAIWGLFDPNSIDPNGPFSGDWITGSYLTTAEGDLTSAETWVANNHANPGNFTALTGATVTIYTPSPNQNASQEYLTVSTPEAATPVLLAGDLLSFLLLIAFFRRKLRAVN